MRYLTVRPGKPARGKRNGPDQYVSGAAYRDFIAWLVSESEVGGGPDGLPPSRGVILQSEVRHQIERHFRNVWGPRDLEWIKSGRHGSQQRWVNLSAWGKVQLTTLDYGRILPLGRGEQKYLVDTQLAHPAWAQAAEVEWDDRQLVPGKMPKPLQPLRGKKRRIEVR